MSYNGYPVGASPTGAAFSGDPWTPTAGNSQGVGQPPRQLPTVVELVAAKVSSSDVLPPHYVAMLAAVLNAPQQTGYMVTRISLTGIDDGGAALTADLFRAYVGQPLIFIGPVTGMTVLTYEPEASVIASTRSVQADETEPLRPYYVPPGQALSLIWTPDSGASSFTATEHYAARVEYFEA